MKKFLLSFPVILAVAVGGFAQKGVDTQTQKIQQDGSRTNNSTAAPINPSSRSFDWGKGKTKVREMLPNPYQLNSRRDILIANILQALKEKKLVVDEAASRMKDGIIVTQPYIFAKGAVITPNELNRYSQLQNTDGTWTRGQYSLTIEVQSIDGIKNNVSVTAKVEGRSGSGLGSEWTTLQSSGVAEDEFLAEMVRQITGLSPDDQPDGKY